MPALRRVAAAWDTRKSQVPSRNKGNDFIKLKSLRALGRCRSENYKSHYAGAALWTAGRAGAGQEVNTAQVKAL